jgi:trk system potassium uptake protein TrkA
MGRKDLRVVIVGGGRVGFHAARQLSDQGHSVVVIERDPGRCERIAESHIATIIEGDGAAPETLEQAGLHRTDVVAALTPDSGTNLGACMLAQRLDGEVRTIIRVSAAERAAAYRDLVDEVVFPERAGAHVAVNAILGSDVQTFETMSGELMVAKMRVAPDAPVAGRTLQQVTLPRGSLVVSDAAADNIAGSETVLEAGEAYIVAVEPEVADEVRQLFQG